jgi:dihydroorotate dehydrogenase
LVRERNCDIALSDSDDHRVAINTLDDALQLKGAVATSSARASGKAATKVATTALAILSELLAHQIRSLESGGVTQLIAAKASCTADHNRHN